MSRKSSINGPNKLKNEEFYPRPQLDLFDPVCVWKEKEEKKKTLLLFSRCLQRIFMANLDAYLDKEGEKKTILGSDNSLERKKDLSRLRRSCPHPLGLGLNRLEHTHTVD